MKRMTTVKFVDRANEVHSNKYDYSLCSYTGAHKKVKIICPKHGLFEQRASSHIEGRGCKACAREQQAQVLRSYRRPSKNTEQFIKEAKEVHGDMYDYSQVNYVNAHTKVQILCSEHGLFEQAPIKHINQKCKCPECALEEIASHKKQTYSMNFTDRAIYIHGTSYVYDNVQYTKARDKVQIQCPTHGYFEQTPNAHLNGHGCPKCKNIGYINKQWLYNHPEYHEHESVLYWIRCSSDNEIFNKIGITTRTISERVHDELDRMFDVEVINSISLPLIESFSIEQFIISRLKEFTYFPQNKFAGYTECLQNVSDVVYLLEIIFNQTQRSRNGDLTKI